MCTMFQLNQSTVCVHILWPKIWSVQNEEKQMKLCLLVSWDWLAYNLLQIWYVDLPTWGRRGRAFLQQIWLSLDKKSQNSINRSEIVLSKYSWCDIPASWTAWHTIMYPDFSIVHYTLACFSTFNQILLDP